MMTLTNQPKVDASENVNRSALIWWVYSVVNSFATVSFLCCHQHYKGNLILPTTFLMSNLST